MSGVCLLEESEAELHRKTGELPDHRGHAHMSLIVAGKRVAAGEVSWAGTGNDAVVMNPVLQPWRWANRRSDSGHVVMQMVRYGRGKTYG